MSEMTKVTEVKIGNLRMSSDMIHGKYVLHTLTGDLHVGHPFIESFLRMVDLPDNAVNENNLPPVVFNGYAKNNPKHRVKIYEVKGRAIACADHTANIIDYKAFMTLLEHVREFATRADYLLFFENSVIMALSDKTFQVEDSEEDALYQHGLYINVPHCGEQTTTMYRMIRGVHDGSMAVMKHRKTAMKISLEGRSTDEVISNLGQSIYYALSDEDLDLEEYLSERIQSLQSTNSSMYELLRAVNSVVEATEDWAAMDYMGVDEILDAYDIHSPNEQSINWLKSAKTPVTRWQLFNLLAIAASRQVDDRHQLMDLMHQAGRVLVSIGDLEDVAPDLDIGSIVSDKVDSKLLNSVVELDSLKDQD